MRWLESNDLGLVLIALIGLIGSIFTGSKVKDVTSKKPDKEAPNPQEFMEVKGALISDKAAERVIQSADAFTAAATMLKIAIDRDVEAKQALTKALNANSASMDRNSEVSQDMRENIRETGDVIGRLKDEMIRAGGRR